MKSYLKNNWIIGLIFVLFACEKEEIALSKPEIEKEIIADSTSKQVIQTTIDMNSDYKYQVYFNLNDNKVVSTNLKTVWDIGFESEGSHIILNTSKAMLCTAFDNADFEKTTTYENKTWKHDVPSGNLDSTAIGNWKEANKAYIIDRGYDELGTHLGYKKIDFQTVDNEKYTFRLSNLDNSDNQVITVKKDASVNFVTFSFDTKKTTIVEPPKTDWDICFTQYQHIFYDQPEPLPYLVTGVLLNPYQTNACADSTTKFSEIEEEDISIYTFKKDWNSIGYDWKAYSFETSSFTVFDYKNYIVKDQKGNYYKLHFLDFYNKSGQKGYPLIEFKQL